MFKFTLDVFGEPAETFWPKKALCTVPFVQPVCVTISVKANRKLVMHMAQQMAGR